MRVRQAALASDPIAEQAAQAQLSAGSGALGAVLAGFFAAAGAYPGTLLGPISVLTGGIGQGARAFDGRLRQPGLGARRPRGILPDAPVPDAALVAVPTAPLATIVALAYASGATLTTVVRPGIEAAQRASAKQRAEWLERFAQVGPAAVTEPSYTRPLLRLGSPSEGGLLTPSDFNDKPEVDFPAQESATTLGRITHVAWNSLAPDATGVGHGAGVCAIDVYGVVAALCYRVFDVGAWCEELELLAPRAAVPVLRGVPRIAPGSRLPSPAPMALCLDASQALEVVIEPESKTLDIERAAPGRLTLRRDLGSQFISALRR